MPLSPGDKLGPYEILLAIGAGGMGEVYKARDTRLDRIVAIKVSKTEFSERFEREARAVAALNHSNICTLHDVVLSKDAPNYLVMEYIKGTPLKGPLPLDQALKYAVQICDALDAAHKKGITHRDLKPANILVTKAGIKLLDFGLAKMQPAPAAGDATRTMALTGQGQILGTLFYMSPEQLQGQEIDARSDIFSFGLVLYEMITGKRAFAGSSPASVIAAIMERPAPSLTDVAPPALDRVFRKCLEKDPDERWQSARDLKDELKWIAGMSTETGVKVSAGRVWAAGAMMLGALLVSTAWLAWIHFRGGAPAAAPVRFQIPFAGVSPTGEAFALSPDGRQLAFASVGPDGIKRLWIRALDSLEARPLFGTEFAQEVIPPIFWAPDSRFIAFDAGRRLKRIDISGGPAQTICELPGLTVGGAWNKDDLIIFGNDAPGVGLMRVSATGGKASPLTNVDRSRNEGLHVLPSFLPDGRHFLYYRNSKTPENAGTYLGSIDAEPGKQDSTRLLAAASVLYAPSSDSSPGQLLFLRGGALLAQRFDAKRLQLTGEPVPVAEQVGSYLAYGFFSLSANGILAYRTRTRDFQLTWLDRQGNAISRVWEPGPYTSMAVSADGTRAVVSRNDLFQGTIPWNLWLLDLARGTSKRFTSAVGRNDYPVWSPDGSRVVFVSSREGGSNSTLNLYQKLAGGAMDEDMLLRSSETKFPTSWSPDGRFLLYTVADPKTKNDIWVLSMEGDHQRKPLLATEFSESQAQFSPNSRWIAYTSDASGRNEIYVRAFPDAKEDYVVSKSGGSSPRWRDDGKELYYISSDGKVMAVEVTPGGLFQPGRPKPLFQVSSVLPEWNVSADGKRFLFAVPVAQTQAPFTVVLNWQAGLKK